MASKQSTGRTPEVAAIDIVYKALEKLPPHARARVLTYVAEMLNIDTPYADTNHEKQHMQLEEVPISRPSEAAVAPGLKEDELEGISPVAKKWMARNDLHAKSLSAVFSLGVDEIDLIAKDVPGKNKKNRMHSVLLLKGAAAYLGNGVARVSHEQIKEACLHYKAFDSANFASYLKSFSSEISGDKTAGYTLTARGLATATEMLKSMLKPDAA